MNAAPRRLSRATLADLPAAIGRPAHDARATPPGIVHFGPGAFHRAHQAAFVDAIMAADPRWGIAEVALNSTSVADALGPQDGLYTLALLSETPRYRVIGSIAELLGARDAAAIRDRLAAPATRLVTATVTEKGYCLTAEGGLDERHPGIARDLANPDVPCTFIGWLTHGLAARRAAGAGGLTILSCDNLAGNGLRLSRAVREFAARVDPDLAAWIEGEVRFPSSMVDSITPATSDAVRATVAAAIGLDDAWPIQREPFAQWVIEEDFADARPPLDEAGVEFVRSVHAFEEAKLRLLNGAHSSLAYLGLLLGHETVAGAMGDAALAGFVERMMREEIMAVLAPLEGRSIAVYIGEILDRFRNPAIRHLLAQIAWDGSQKLPFRLIGTIADRRRRGLPTGRLALPIAAWFRFLTRERPNDDPLVDPMGDRLVPLARAGDWAALLGQTALFPATLAADEEFRRAIATAHAAVENRTAITKALEDAS